jgi:hypothetical protein
MMHTCTTAAGRRRVAKPAATPAVAGRKVVKPAEAADIIRERGRPASVSALKRWRLEGGGPPYVRVGNRAHYPVDLLEAWLDEQFTATVSSTAEEAGLRRSGVAA